jgi:hypothetical protein
LAQSDNDWLKVPKCVVRGTWCVRKPANELGTPGERVLYARYLSHSSGLSLAKAFCTYGK